MAGLKLVNKLKRREKNVQTSLRGRKYSKMDKRSSTLADSPGAARAQRHSQRRLDRSFGQDFCAHDPSLASPQILCDSLERFDFGSSDFGLLLTLAPTVGGEIAERTQITTVGSIEPVAGEAEEFTLTAPDFATAGQADYFTFEAPNGDIYAVWLDKDAADVPPTGAAYMAADEQVEVEIVTGNTAAQVAAAIVLALGPITDMTITDNLDGTVSFLYDDEGVRTDADMHNSDDTGDGSLSIAIDNQGVDEVVGASLNDKYFYISSPDTDYYVWFNVAAGGTDPMEAGMTGIEVALAGDESAEDVATALAAALDAEDDFEASALDDSVEVMNSGAGSAADASDEDTGFSFAVLTQGMDQNRLGVIAGDVVQIQNGSIAGRYLKVESIVNGTQLRLEDQEDFDEDDDGQEDDVWAQFLLSSVKPSYT